MGRLKNLRHYEQSASYECFVGKGMGVDREETPTLGRFPLPFDFFDVSRRRKIEKVRGNFWSFCDPRAGRYE